MPESSRYGLILSMKRIEIGVVGLYQSLRFVLFFAVFLPLAAEAVPLSSNLH